MKSVGTVVAVCRQKRTLQKECAAALDAYGAYLREYLKAAVEGGDAFIASKSRAEEGREKCRTALKQYFDHCEERG